MPYYGVPEKWEAVQSLSDNPVAAIYTLGWVECLLGEVCRVVAEVAWRIVVFRIVVILDH